MDVRGTVLSALALSLVGCAAPVPVSETFPLTYQKVARTAHHWDVVADHVIGKTSAYLEEGATVFVPTTKRDSTFDSTFRGFLTTRLFEQKRFKVSVCDSPGGAGFMGKPATRIKFETQVIPHAEMPQYRPGVLTALASGVFVAHSIGASDASSDARWLAGIAAVGVGEAALGHVTRTPRTEIVVTTTIEEDDKFVMRRNDIYYVPEGDYRLYTERVAYNPSSCPQDNRRLSMQDEQNERLVRAPANSGLDCVGAICKMRSR